jgi:cytochrome c biogenesis protein CcdA
MEAPHNIFQVESGIPQGSCLGPIVFSILSLALSKGSVLKASGFLYADDSTVYTSATTAGEMTATLNKELQLVSKWVAWNKFVLNISKTKSIVFGTNHSLNPKPQLNHVMKNVEI